MQAVPNSQGQPDNSVREIVPVAGQADGPQFRDKLTYVELPLGDVDKAGKRAVILHAFPRETKKIRVVGDKHAP